MRRLNNRAAPTRSSCWQQVARHGLLLAALSLGQGVAPAAVRVTSNHNGEDASAGFVFRSVAQPLHNDVAASATFTLLDGRGDRNGGGLEQSHDGFLPTDADQPSQNFFFAAGTTGGRLRVELARLTEIKGINTYSWHPGSRGPQVYVLYGADGSAGDFDVHPANGTDPEQVGWIKLAQVDTCGDGGGQFGVRIDDANGMLGKYRYLLFDISPTETNDPFGNTFYSEIDVVEWNAPGEAIAAGSAAAPLVVVSSDENCRITIETGGAPELAEWARASLAPVLVEWYPRITALLASDGFTAPMEFSVRIAPGNGVAATRGTRISANSRWLKGALQGEAVGAIVHELVHVVQQYGRPGGGGAPPPGWLVEGIADYVRFFIYEPQTHGADAVWFRGRWNMGLNYDGMYRVSANFLDYVIRHYDSDRTLLQTINAACRNGEYRDEIWTERTGKTLQELNEEWRSAMQSEFDPNTAKTPSQLSPGQAPPR